MDFNILIRSCQAYTLKTLDDANLPLKVFEPFFANFENFGTPKCVTHFNIERKFGFRFVFIENGTKKYYLAFKKCF